MIETIHQLVINFLDKFIASPSGDFGGIPWSLEQIIRAEATHSQNEEI